MKFIKCILSLSFLFFGGVAQAYMGAKKVGNNYVFTFSNDAYGKDYALYEELESLADRAGIDLEARCTNPDKFDGGTFSCQVLLGPGLVKRAFTDLPRHTSYKAFQVQDLALEDVMRDRLEKRDPVVLVVRELFSQGGSGCGGVSSAPCGPQFRGKYKDSALVRISQSGLFYCVEPGSVSGFKGCYVHSTLASLRKTLAKRTLKKFTLDEVNRNDIETYAPQCLINKGSRRVNTIKVLHPGEAVYFRVESPDMVTSKKLRPWKSSALVNPKTSRIKRRVGSKQAYGLKLKSWTFVGINQLQSNLRCVQIAEQGDHTSVDIKCQNISKESMELSPAAQSKFTFEFESCNAPIN